MSKYRFWLIIFVFVSVICLFSWGSSATAAALQVPSTSYPDIQSAINAADVGDTVAVAAGTYSGTGNWDLDFNGKAITVQCTAVEPETCTIDCSGLAWHRGFYFHNGEGPDSVLDGFTITGGQANEGGAISCVSASPTITNCKFTDNESKISHGGAIYCSNASPTISYCAFSNNNSPYSGGAIYCTESEPNVAECTFSANEAAHYGGGIYFDASSDATITGCAFTNNRANFGAGIACKSSSPVISNSTFETNTADYYGGAIYCTAASPDVSECTMTGNTGTRMGGGIYCEAASAPIISNCSINTNASPGSPGFGGGIYSTESTPNVSGCDLIGNTALSGAGIYSDDSPMTIENCNISSNIAGLTNGQYGGGIHINFGSPTISDSTIIGNSAYDGGGIRFYSAFPAVYNTIISGNTADRYGGGIYGGSSNASFVRCLIEDNEAQFGGGIRISGGTTTGTISVANCIITNNTADYGAGVDIYSSSPVFINNTVIGNTAYTEGGGVRYYSSSSATRPEFVNTILRGDSPEEIKVISGAILVEYCNVQGGYTGPGNIDNDPMFRDSVNKEFHLTSGSPCIDAATSLYAPPVDYDETARWDDPDTPNTGVGYYSFYDIGAFEYYPACHCDFPPADGDVDGFDLVTYIGDNAGISLGEFATEFGKINCP